MPLDLEKELAFYGAYHSHPMNKVVHCTSVPLLLLSGAVALRDIANVGSVALPFLRSTRIALNFPTAIVAMYSSFYLYLDAPSGLLWTLLQGLPVLVLANCPCLLDSVANPTAAALAAHAALWAFQVIVGHMIFEKRKPALVDSAKQAFLTAPLFVMLEMLFPLGYKRGLHERVTERVKKILGQME
eukprot:PhM_4_TR5615/c0_g2_i1/m.4004